MLRFKYSILLLLLCATSNLLSAKDLDLTLTEAINKNLIKVTSISNGQMYDEKALNIKIENTGKKTLNITIDPALIFVPNDTAYQDLMVAGDITLNIEPAAFKIAVMKTYCAKHNAGIPKRDLVYTYRKQADSSMIKMLAYVKKYKINNELTQKAVWMFSDHEGLNTVYDPADEIASRDFSLFLAMLTKSSLPDYYKYFPLNNIDTTETTPQPIVPLKPLKIFAVFKWVQKDDANLSLLVADDKGKVIQPLFEKQLFKKGGYELTAKFESADADSGNYFIRLMEGNTVLKEIKVNVD